MEVFIHMLLDKQLRYEIVRLGNKLFNWNLQVVNKEKGTIQFVIN